MPVDIGIYQNALRPIRSVADYDAEAQAREQNALGLQTARQNLLMGQQKASEYQRGLAEQEQLRGALRGLGAQATDEQRIQALKGTGLPGGFTQADALQKMLLEQRKGASEIDKNAAQTGHYTTQTRGLEQDQALKGFTQHVQQVSSVADHDGAVAWALKARALGVGPMADMPGAQFVAGLSRIPTDPQGLQAWKDQVLQGGMTAAQQAEQKMKEREFGLKANNELLTPDGKGGYRQNLPLISAKASIAKAGKTDVNVGINTEKTYAGHIAEGLAKNDVASLDAARTAPDRVNTARAVLKVLDSGNAITGAGADARLAITKALSTAGVIDGKSTTATEDLVSMLNSQTLDAIKTSGLGAGQGFTDRDRQFLQDAKSGRIEINAATLRRMAKLNEQAALATIEYGNKIAGRLKGNPTLGSVGQDLAVQPPRDLASAIEAEAARRAALKAGK